VYEYRFYQMQMSRAGILVMAVTLLVFCTLHTLFVYTVGTHATFPEIQSTVNHLHYNSDDKSKGFQIHLRKRAKEIV